VRILTFFICLYSSKLIVYVFLFYVGYYEFEECPNLGSNPTLGMKKGVSYVFKQVGFRLLNF